MAIIHALEAGKIFFTVTRYRFDAISIQAVVPGERWEIDVLEDGRVDFERFVSAGDIEDESTLTVFINRFAEPAEEARG